VADETAQLVDEIASRVRRRLDALRAGTEEPCTASDGRPAAGKKGDGECAESCFSCRNVDSCATVSTVKQGAARIAPDRLRTSADIAPFIDHTLLKADATREEVVKLAEEARKYGFATVCVNSSNIGTAARVLAGSTVAKPYLRASSASFTTSSRVASALSRV
jgi:deoxyribose-phosphate aldolase